MAKKAAKSSTKSKTKQSSPKSPAKKVPKTKRNFINTTQRYLHINFGGLVGGLILAAMSFTPSLLPRGMVLQGALTGISFAMGYGVGVAVAFFAHMLPRKYRFVLSRQGKIAITSLLLLLALVVMVLGFQWQAEIRKLTESTAAPMTGPVSIVLIAAVVAILLIWASRGIRRFAQFIGRQLNRVLPRKVAIYGGGLLAAILLVFLVNGVIVNGAFAAINYTFGLVNGGTPTGVHQPQTGPFSGTPESLIDWNTLGEKGREFVASGPSQTDVAKYSGETAKQPSRLYVGLESADSTQDRVDLLVKELERTNAKDRKAILIAIPTGSGGVDAKSVQTVEYMYGGDTTTLAIQYSYLPSWLSFLADQDKVRTTGAALTNTVYSWWNKLDPATRPKLLFYGESLGTLGADGAFSGVDDMHNRMNGVLLVGPPNANELWKGIVADRDSGSREVLPVYKKGEIVRFTDGEQSLASSPSNQKWSETNRIGVIQHASDPVVWWSPSLLLHIPNWLQEPRGSDVLPQMQWYRFVTFWQVAGDLPFAFGVSAGHGHNYGNSMVMLWNDVLNAQLTPEQFAKLKDIINTVKG